MNSSKDRKEKPGENDICKENRQKAHNLEVIMKKILIVEDNPTNRRLLRDVLKYYGYEVLEAADGKEGVSMAIEYLPDLVLMDLQMPVMDGIQAGIMLKNEPKTRDIKIIALTSFAMKGDRDRVMKAGFDDYISKPIDTRSLPRILELHLGTGKA